MEEWPAAGYWFLEVDSGQLGASRPGQLKGGWTGEY